MIFTSKSLIEEVTTMELGGFYPLRGSLHISDLRVPGPDVPTVTALGPPWLQDVVPWKLQLGTGIGDPSKEAHLSRGEFRGRGDLMGP